VAARKDTSRDQVPVVVGIGASAGGLEALKRLLPGLPADAGAGYVVVQHLDPRHPSLLAELLKPASAMPVLLAEDEMPLAPGRIYIAPPGTDIGLEGGRFRLLPRTASPGPAPSVDVFLASLARACGERAVAVILSGAGFDGVQGLRAIKSAGGVTMAQAEDSARFDGMPGAAIKDGHVDRVLPPEAIGPEIAAIIRLLGQPAVSAEHSAEALGLERILKAVRRVTNLDFAPYKPSTLCRRVQRRMALAQCRSPEEYLAYLQRDPAEAERLADDFLISVTEFFRDPEAFAALDPLLEALVRERGPGGVLRVWVPGAATGEEAYSLAILLAEICGRTGVAPRVQIFATDLDAEAVALARRGVYAPAAMAGVVEERRRRWFRVTAGGYQVQDVIRDLIVFSRHDLLSDPPFQHLDLISCRNVLIYLGGEAQHELVPLFHNLLSPGGLLFMGISESLGQYGEYFELAERGAKIFRRRENVRPRRPALRRARAAMIQNQDWPQPGRPKASPLEALRRELATAFAPAGVLVDEQLEILAVHGDVSPYLRLAQGEPGLGILTFADGRLRVELRTLIRKALRKGTAVSGGLLKAGSAEVPAFRVMVRPVSFEPGGEPLGLVAFVPEPGAAQTQRAPAEGEPDPQLVELERELTETQSRLETAVGELETANEELMSLNEELQSANEELQSANEELESANEELQSANEELTTVNDELTEKSAALASALADVENILHQVGLPLIIVDEKLNITRATPQAKELFGLQPGASVQPVTEVPRLAGLSGVLGRLAALAGGLALTHEEEVRLGGRLYLLRLTPYLKRSGEPLGAMLLFFDRTEAARSAMSMGAVTDISRLFLQGLPREEIYRRLTGILAERFACDKVFIGFFDEAGRDLVLAGALGLDEDGQIPWRIPLAGTIHQLVLTRSRPALDKGGPDCPFDHGHLGRVAPRTVVCAPIPGSGETVGTLTVAYDQTPPLDVDLAEPLAVIAIHLGQEIARSRAMRALSEHKAELERRVAARTAELAEKNARLSCEIEERRAAELALAESSAAERERARQLAAILEFVPAAVWIAHDPDCSRISGSRASYELLRLPYGSHPYEPAPGAPAMAFRMVKDGRELPLSELPLRRAARGEDLRGFEEDVVFADGEVRHLVANAVPLRGAGGELAGAVAAFMDITERRRMEEELRAAKSAAEAANLAKNQFLANMSHELRTPLAGINGMTQLILSRTGDSESRTYLAHVLDAARALGEIIEDLLDISRIESGAMTLKPTVFALRPFLEQLLAVHQLSAERKGLGLHLDSDPDLPESVEADAGRLGQILRNLLSNAVKYTDRGSVGLRVRPAGPAGRPAMVAFAVADTGVGIPEDKLGAVFQTFYQVENVLTKEHQGVGLGLAISRHLAQLLGGDIEVESRPGQGSVFTVCLPLAPVADPEEVQKPAQATYSPLGGLGAVRPPRRVLVVEDNRLNRLFMERILVKAGHLPATAVDGPDALGQVRAREFDLVLMDIQMPVMDGLETLARLRELPGPSGRVPVVALTAYAGDEDRQRFLEAGMAAVLVKPVDLEELAGVLSRFGPVAADARSN
jgi:two-component system CheB/CheR fusion protein